MPTQARPQPRTPQPQARAGSGAKPYARARDFRRDGDDTNDSRPHRDASVGSARSVASQRADSTSGHDQRRHAEKVDHPILFQHFFKSVGPRTYAAQVKKATNGNHYIVFTEGRRDDKTGEVRKTRINIFSEDFDAFFDLLRQAAQYVKAHPLPPEFVAKRKKLWAAIAKKKGKSGAVSQAGQDVDTRRRGPAASGEARFDRAGRGSSETPRRANASEPSTTLRDRPGSGCLEPPSRDPRQDPPATTGRFRAGRPIPTARAVAGG